MSEIKEELSLVVHKVLILKLSCNGHVVFWSDGLEKTFMFGMGNGNRGSGRPRRRCINEVMKSTGL